MFRTSVLPLIFTLLLAACSTVPPTSLDEPERTVLYETRLDRLTGLSTWTLQGRLAVSNMEDGGSGHFSWTEHEGGTRMDFYGALGRGAWSLVADAGGAELKLSDGTVHRAAAIGELIHTQVGWEVPVATLSWWARGLAAPGEFETRVLDDEGFLSRLQQSGWIIEYGKYRVFDSTAMPVRLEARQADWTIKLAVKDWTLAPALESDD